MNREVIELSTGDLYIKLGRTIKHIDQCQRRIDAIGYAAETMAAQRYYQEIETHLRREIRLRENRS